MKKLFLHIGMHKTASSSIQNSMAGFSDGMTRYARLGNAAGENNHSVALFMMFSENPEKHNRFTIKGHRPDRVDADVLRYKGLLMDEIAASEPALILSGEGVTNLEREEVHNMRIFMAEHFTEMQVIAYVRDPMGYASSIFQEKVKRGFLSKFQFGRADYKKRFAKFVSIFGHEAVSFTRFNRAAFQSESIIDDFCAKVGVDSKRVLQVTSNESLSTECVALLYRWNKSREGRKVNPRLYRARNRVVNELRKSFPGSFSLSSDLAEQAVDLVDCNWMHEASGIDVRQGMGVGQGGVGSEHELMQIGVDAAPKLVSLAEEKGLRVANKTNPTAVLQQLFHAQLVEERQKLTRP